MEFIFDIETSGLPKFPIKRKRGDPFPSPELFSAYDTSRIVSVCWMIIDKETKDIIQQEYYIIKPDNFIIPPEVIAIHGITNEYATEYGKSINFVIMRMLEALKKVDSIIAYNIEFDYNITKSEMLRLDNLEAVAEFDNKTQICCMKMASKYMKINYNTKLGNAYKYMMGKEIQDAHNAIGDVASCYQIYKHMNK